MATRANTDATTKLSSTGLKDKISAFLSLPRELPLLFSVGLAVGEHDGARLGSELMGANVGF
jgi:hypothetical protein